MSGPRYYPKPGTLTTAWWETGSPYRQVHGAVAVLSNSRHIDSITVEQGLALLAGEYGPDVRIDQTDVWYSVTAFDVEHGFCGESDPGDWSNNGSGAAWVRVLYPLIEEETDG